MDAIGNIPEIQGLDARQHLIRIPHELDVPLTSRIRQIIDTEDFRRLSRISQLGLVSLVYPAAHHTGFEHALGVYRMALLYLKRLAFDTRFVAAVTPDDAQVFLVAALLHDLGHWPFCHPIEDIRLPGVPDHEMFANSFLWKERLPTRCGRSGILRRAKWWGCCPASLGHPGCVCCRACCPVPSMSIRWIISTGTVSTRACLTGSTSISSG